MDLEYALGLKSDGQYEDKYLEEIAKDTVIFASVIDKSKLGGCENGDLVQLNNIGDGKWLVKHVKTGSAISVNTSYNNGNFNFQKIGSMDIPESNVIYDSKTPMGLKGSSAFGIRVSYVNFADDSYILYGVKVDTEVENAPMFGLNFSYFPSDYFSLEFSADYVESDVTLSALGLSAESGKLKQIPLLLVGRLNAPVNDVFMPYIGGGFGFFINDFDQDNNVIEALYGRGAEVSVDNSFGFLVNGGLDLFFAKNFAFNLDIKYIWNEIEAQVNRAGFTDVEFNPDMFVFGGGIKYYF
jgi:outer membrane protein W